ncbi:katanin p60 ATPase-containing subunit A-like 1 [Schistocerca piceifrons]|uniref:katanin p60 ATPase-containing subunit A-like 1 n=1 Tax=Schistocerca piceifrons TaxID=274613 RepID=UPI001F5EB6DA|nr:katanin p60 ATPase-containing subunit A-like 1 [Schistocerca piceifrons]
MFASALFAEFFRDPFFRVGISPVQSPQWTTFDTFPAAKSCQDGDWGFPSPISYPREDTIAQAAPIGDRRLVPWKPVQESSAPPPSSKKCGLEREVCQKPRKTTQRKVESSPRQRPLQPSASASAVRAALDAAQFGSVQCVPIALGHRSSPRPRPPQLPPSRVTQAWMASLRKPDVKRSRSAAGPATAVDSAAAQPRQLASAHKAAGDGLDSASDGVAASEPELLSLIRGEVLLADPGVSWDDVAGLEAARDALREATVLPLRLPGYFSGIRTPCRALLLAGPPGTGKTLLVRALATESRGQLAFFNVSSSTLTSRWRGDSEKLVRLLFAEARSRAPSVIFIDEVDALCCARGSPSEHEASRRFKAELLVAMDGLLSGTGVGAGKSQPHVVLVAATNHPWDLDDAFLRRFERRVHVPLPDEASRRRLAEVCLRGVATEEGVDAATEVASRTQGFSGADVAAACRCAAMAALRQLVRDRGVDAVAALPADRLQPPLSLQDLRVALAAARPTVRRSLVRRYTAWAKKFATD